MTLSDVNQPLHVEAFAPGCNCLVIMQETMEVTLKFTACSGVAIECFSSIAYLVPCLAGRTRLHEALDWATAARHAPFSKGAQSSARPWPAFDQGRSACWVRPCIYATESSCPAMNTSVYVDRTSSNTLLAILLQTAAHNGGPWLWLLVHVACAER